MKLTTKQKVLITISLITSIISSYLLILAPDYLGRAVDLMIGVNNVDFDKVKIVLLTTSLIYIIYFTLNWIINYIAHYISINTVKDLRSQLEYTLNRNPLSYLDTHPHGAMMNLFSIDAEILTDGINQLLSQLFSGIFTVLFALYFMLKVNVVMTIFTILMVPLMYLTSSYIAKKSLIHFKGQQKLAANINAHINEALSNHELISNYNYQDESLKRFESIHEPYNEVGLKTQILGALVNPTVRVINNFSYALLGLIGALYAINGNLSIGEITSFITFSIIFSKPFNEFSAIISQIVNAKASFERIQKSINEPIELDDQVEVELENSNIIFNNVDFGYKKDNLIIKDLNLNIAPLSKVAIVGPTGAGKSTIINILMRFYDVDSGEININNYNIEKISKESSRNLMSIVLQDPWLFEGSIRDNIKYGNTDASDEEMITAAKQAGCYDYIMSLDKQFDTKITLGSHNMSLGQKQMITIARAIIRDTPIIILDEATSNVDIVTESKIQKVFQNIMLNKTSFFIAHRLSTVIDSDIILVMKDGRLIESGKHLELMNNKGFYFELYNSQMYDSNQK